MTMFDSLWLLFALPAFGALMILFAGRWLSQKVVGWIASAAVLGAFAVALLSFLALLSLPAEERSITITYWQWITIGDFEIPAAVLYDPLSALMALTVTGVGALIHIYAIGYMDHEPRYQRFFFYLNFFILAMLVLVMGNNFLVTFVGWEGVGLASYLLIGFWFEQRDDQYGWYADAGKKAFLVNRVGDAAYLVAMFIIWTSVGSLAYDVVTHDAATLPTTTLIFITLLLLFAVSGKSAQFPLYVWLPEAMAGPTPVSALIHAATMVTAGVYLIARTGHLWELAGPDVTESSAGSASSPRSLRRRWRWCSTTSRKSWPTPRSRSLATWWRRRASVRPVRRSSSWWRTPSSKRCSSWALAASCTPPAA
jgi:NADH-quinone oxidoreductase subunit L